MKFSLLAALPALAQASVADVQRVHVIFSNHLDVGFDGIHPTLGYATNVVNKYFEEFFPRAVATAQDMPGDDRYVWLTQSWLVAMYLDPGCAELNLNISCPTEAEVASVEEAISRGDISWHAFPFNAQPETYSPGMFEYGLEMTHALDDRFNLSRKGVLSQRDVPGMTVATLPLLAAHGVRAVSVGVNKGSAPPALPDLFRWTEPESNTTLYAMQHPGGYGGITVDDCVVVEDTVALCANWRGDNSGPEKDPESVNKTFVTLRDEFPNADVFASSYDAFVDELEALEPLDLLEYSGEIGDTWTYTTAGDPLKNAQVRALMRARAACAADDPPCGQSAAAFDRFSRLLLKAGEHTWGGDVKSFLLEGTPRKDYHAWSNDNFASHADDAMMRALEGTWVEQRQWAIQHAVDALDAGSAFRAQAEALLAAAHAAPADVAAPPGFEPVEDVSAPLVVGGRFQLALNATSGAVEAFTDLATNATWAAAGSTPPLLEIVYQTLDDADYRHFIQEYIYAGPVGRLGWLLDFAKPGFASARPEHLEVPPTLAAVYRNASDGALCLEHRMPDALRDKYGAPEAFYLHLSSSDDEALDVRLAWANKTTTRMPEAMWLRFHGAADTWSVSKLGTEVSPYGIVLNGSNHLHGSWDGLTATSALDGARRMRVQSPDLPVFRVGGGLSPLPTPFTDNQRGEPASSLLYNNAQGTNTIMWYPYLEEDKDGVVSYRLSFS